MEIKEEIKTVRYIEYDGLKFYQDGNGYWIGNFNGGRKRLHVYVWEKYNGKVPDGYHIHHKDFNTDNNELDNLQLLTAHEHLSLHAQMESSKAKARVIMNTIIRPKAIKWHKSKKSTEFHKKNYEISLRPLMEKKIDKICIVCGKEFQCCANRPDSKFCSKSCKAKFRRDSGVDNIERVCICCGKTFTTNKYSKAKTCSIECKFKIRFNKE